MPPAEHTSNQSSVPLLHFGRSYVLLVGLPLLGIAWVLSRSWTLPASSAAIPADLPKSSQFSGSTDLFLLLSQVVVILLVSRILGRLLRRVGQPQVVGEMAAGILLGPSFLGVIFPQVSNAIFPDSSLGFINALSQVGIVLFLFVVGLELDPALLRGRTQTAVLTSHASITMPFFMAVLLAQFLYPHLSGAGIAYPQFALFLGAAMSVTAFPVLARILTERNLLTSRLGMIAITCAAVDDVSAWCILAAVSALVRNASAGHPIWLTAGGTIVYAALVLTVGRKLLAGLATRFERKGAVTADMVAVVIVSGLMGAMVTEWLGVHALFGAFVMGAAMPKHPKFVSALRERFVEVLTVLLLPLFFAYTGLRTQLGLIHGAEMWGYCAAIVAVAIAGKLGGSTLASRLSGLSWRESTAIGILMNTRGLIELVFLNIGLELGVLSPPLFAMMVLMALGTTLMTTPLIAWIWPTPENATQSA
ncbi:MAG: cation:proton antiporter [Acidobacteria bacterium]|nr:cation:proton antiporter [Acidobacteriota bacterium]